MLDLIIFNLDWMSFNLSLAIIPVILAWSAYLIKNKILKTILLIIWLTFIPNAIYIITDVLHLIEQTQNISPLTLILLHIQYLIFITLGLLTHILSLYPIEKMLKNQTLLIAINFLIGFGIVLGRIHRLNSWDLILDLQKVFNAAQDTLSSPEMILLALLFGLFSNLIYFLFKEKTIKIIARASFDKKQSLTFNGIRGEKYASKKKSQSSKIRQKNR